MKYFILCKLLLLCFLTSLAQHKVRFEIKSLPPNHKAGNVYLAGSFNGWNPQHGQYQFKQDISGNYFLELANLPPGNYEYKITRGGWDKSETNADGSSTGNRSLTLPINQVIEITIANWADNVPPLPRKSTASRNVRVMQEHFPMDGAGKTRRVWIYLPPGYESNNKKYPVLYMQDGQNVFEDTSSFAGEWGVDEMMDTALHACIVVAVDHAGPKRTNEYAPYDMEKYGSGEGEQYVRFLAKTLKPYVDKHYRTMRKKENTFVAGSSMGGLISMYAILKYPKVFGAAGVFSPSFWIAPGIYDEIARKGEKIKGKIYFYAGKQEGDDMVSDMLKAFQSLHAVSKANMTTVIRDEGKHNEASWRAEFKGFYEWIRSRVK